LNGLMVVKAKDNKGNLSSRVLILIFVLLAAGITIMGRSEGTQVRFTLPIVATKVV